MAATAQGGKERPRQSVAARRRWSRSCTHSSLREELRRLRELTVRVAAEEGELDYLVGTMIELPRACVRADEIAEHADFFSFGTNDLTQTALGISRDDGGRFLAHYLETASSSATCSRRSTRAGSAS